MKMKLEHYIDRMIKDAETFSKSTKDVLNHRAIAFGATQFCIDAELIPFDEVSKLWDIKYKEFNKILEKFY